MKKLRVRSYLVSCKTQIKTQLYLMPKSIYFILNPNFKKIVSESHQWWETSLLLMKMRFPYLPEIHTYTEKWERHIPELNFVSWFFPMEDYKENLALPCFWKGYPSLSELLMNTCEKKKKVVHLFGGPFLCFWSVHWTTSL